MRDVLSTTVQAIRNGLQAAQGNTIRLRATVNIAIVLKNTGIVKHEYCTTGTTIVKAAEGRRQTKNIRAGPRVALMAIDPQNP